MIPITVAGSSDLFTLEDVNTKCLTPLTLLQRHRSGTTDLHQAISTTFQVVQEITIWIISNSIPSNLFFIFILLKHLYSIAGALLPPQPLLWRLLLIRESSLLVTLWDLTVLWRALETVQEFAKLIITSFLVLVVIMGISSIYRN